MAHSTANALSTDELAYKQRKLGYRLKKSRVSYAMMAPYWEHPKVCVNLQTDVR